ncbi:MAG: alpha/beta hydrolase [Pseudomonadota bacterium]
MQLLAEAPPVQAPDPAVLAEYRAELRAYYTPGVERAIAASGVAVSDAQIAGVSCLELLPNEPKPGTILYCYGGGFVSGSPFEDLIVAAPLAQLAARRVIMPNYRLAPEHPWPASIDDGYAVYRSLTDVQPFGLAGESAGGNMALALILRARAEGLPLPSAMALLSPWCDLTHGGDSLTANDGRDPTLSFEWVKLAAELYADGADRSKPDISPLFGKFGSWAPPTMITTGTRDLLQSHAVCLSRVLKASGIPTDINIWDGLWHVFEFDDRLPEAAQSIAAIAEFVSAHMDGVQG